MKPKKTTSTPKVKEPVKIRQKPLKHGGFSLYLDCNMNGNRWPEFLKLYLLPNNAPNAKERNTETLELATAIKSRRITVVANAMIDENCKTHTMLVLTGEQGAFKTTWLDNLCPPDLRQYLYTGKIDPSNKDTQTLLAEFFLVNVDDQLKQLNKKDENDLKNMITAPNVKYRRPYDIFIQEYPHVCSFMASVNGNEFLTDPTGSRRFLAFEVMQIHIEKAQKLDMNLVWKQAYHLFKNKFRYWFAGEEIDELHTSNADFQVVSMEEQFLLRYFAKPEHRTLATHYLQPAEILSQIQILTGVRIRQKLLGEALTKHGFEKWRLTANNQQQWVYSVIKLDLEQVYQQQTAK